MTRVAVLGAGPIGLEAALAATERGMEPVVYERAPRVAAHVRDWGHVRMFSPWGLNLSPRVRAILGPGAPPDDRVPAGAGMPPSPSALG